MLKNKVKKLLLIFMSIVLAKFTIFELWLTYLERYNEMIAFIIGEIIFIVIIVFIAYEDEKESNL